MRRKKIMKKIVVTLNEKEHAEMAQELEATRDYLFSTIEMLRDRENVLQAEYETLMTVIEMAEESLLQVNGALIKICMP